MLGLSALALASFGLTSCQDDFDAPAIQVPEAANEANVTIMQLKEAFWQDAYNYAETVGDLSEITGDEADAGKHVYIKGVVTSSDEPGNIFKSLYLQDATGSIKLSINSYNLYLSYRRGQEIVLDATGMFIGKYAGTMQFGWEDETNGEKQVSFMSSEIFDMHRELNGMPDIAKIDTIEIASVAELKSTVTPELMRKYQSQIVRIRNVEFNHAGEATFAYYHSSGVSQGIHDENGSVNDSVAIRTSGYSTFWNNVLPAGVGDIVAMCDYYQSSASNGVWQLTLIDLDGCIGFTDPANRPGNENNPYNVLEVIDLEAANRAAEGWVEGYIVGAVAGGVESITSSSDIEWTAPTTMANTLVIANDPDVKDISQCLVVALPSESSFREVGNLRDNPDNLGKKIKVKGTFALYMDTYGITGNKGTKDEFEIEGVEVPDKPVQPGQPATIMATSLTVPGTTSIDGYEVTIDKAGGFTTPALHANTSAVRLYNGNTITVAGAGMTSITFTLSSDAGYRYTTVSCSTGSISPAQAVGDKSFTWVGSASEVTFTVDEIATLGTESDQKGQIRFTQLDINGGAGGSTTPDDPVVTTPAGDGTAASPYNVAKALELINAGTIGEDAVYVKGVITKIKEVDTSTYGNATFWIGDNASDATTLYIFRTMWLDGEKFTSADQIAVGGEVVLYGQLVNYMGNTPEMTQGGKVISYTAGSGSGSGSGSGTVTPPAPAGDETTIAATSITNVPGSTVVDGYTFVIDKAAGSTNPAAHAGTSAIRLYADNTIEISGGRMAKITFTLASDAGGRYTTMTPSTGEISPAQAAGDTSFTWVGDATSVTFTVGHDATLGTDGSGARGQVRFTSISIAQAK